jgi:hypothetical protein
MGKTNRDRLRNRQGDDEEEEYVDGSPARKMKNKRRRREVDMNLKNIVRDGYYKEEEDGVVYDDLMED